MEYHCNDCKQDFRIELMTIHQKHLCKKCSAIRIKQWRSKNSDRNKQIEIKSRLKQADKIKEKRRAKYLAGEPRSPNYIEVNKVWKIKNREKVNAKAAVRYAVKIGKLTRPGNCSYCNSTICIVAHHPDYSKRLEVIWICQSCHKRLHSHHHHAIQDSIKH